MKGSNSSSARYVLQAAGLGSAYVAAAVLGLRLAFGNPHVTAVWPPTGIAVAVLFLFGTRLWPAVAAGAFVANILTGASPQLALGISVGNTIAPIVAVHILRRAGFRPALERPFDVGALFVGGGFVSMIVSATLGTLSLAVAHSLGAGGAAVTWGVWWVGDSMGVVLFAPVIFALACVRPNPIAQRPRSAVLLFAVTLAGAWILFLTHLHLDYLAPMFFFALPAIAALQFQQPGAAVSTAVVATMGILTTVAHTGMIAAGSPTTKLVIIQTFNMGLAITALTLAVVVRQRLCAEANLRRAADQLAGRVRERTELLQESQRLAHIGSFRWDAKTNTNTWTDELYRIYGMEPGSEAPSFEAYMSRIHPDFVEEVQRTVDDAVAHGRAFEHDYRIKHPSSEERWVHAFGEIVTNERGEMVGLQGTCQDITERKLAERVVQDAYELERAAAEHLRELDESKTVFLEAVSHELRTPLTVIFGVASLLQTGDLELDDEESPGLLRSLESSAHRLQSLLDDLLDLDRLRRGVVVRPKRRPTPVADLMANVVATLDIGQHPVYVDSHETVRDIDPAQTERIVENLVTNALKHTPPRTPIWLRADETDDGVVIVVSDAGPGVPENIRQALFEPFVKDTRGHVPGTGIGLSLVQRFAQLHGGRAWVEERDGGGASFHVYLPVASPGEEVTTTAA